MEPEKVDAAAAVEMVEKQQLDLNTDSLMSMPASLTSLSPEEYERLGKKATLKMDLVIVSIYLNVALCRLTSSRCQSWSSW